MMGWETNVYCGDSGPPPVVIDYISHYNTTDGTNIATVSDISISNRYISNPGTFDIGSWVAGTIHPVTRSDNLIFDSINACSILNNSTTTMTVNIYGADNLTKIASQEIIITGNSNTTVDNIRIRISDFGTDEDKYQARIYVNINIGRILSDSGKFSVELLHVNSTDGTFIKKQEHLFYDVEMLSSTLSNITVSERTGNVVTRHLSGIEYYTIGSQFEINIADIDNLNSDTYPNIQVHINGSEYALPSIDLTRNELTGWNSDWDNVNSSYNKLDWEVVTPNITTISSTGNISARTVDWSNGTYVNSPDQSILIETHNINSDRLYESFYDESWRCSLSGDFDLPNQRGWDSSATLTHQDACYINGGVKRINVDYTSYLPINNPDYTSQYSTVILIREFITSGSASSGFTVFINGTWDNIEWKLASSWDGTSSGGTNWISLENQYNAGTWNHGEGNCGGQIGTNTATEIHNTFGTNNPIFTNNTLYLRISLVDGNIIDSLRVEFD